MVSNRGVDRLTSWDVSFVQDMFNLPFGRGDALWNSFQDKIVTFVNNLQGNTVKNTAQIHRPDWAIVKDVLEGRKPLSVLSTDCN
ncbi:hypothetical protein [Sphingobacterium tabacisoli]|uniref:Uncharacterized protein n=1 Tax=Sphingobacterium tabacisoli TaxID=2044855 RepID=A0ABW5L5E4_9SPHI|nr:hypothetical protein [Sphingobacterium tabacisoli]